MLKNLVSLNAGLFNVSAKIKAMFPLLPTNLESYCELLPSIVRSLGIETNTLSQAQVTSFNKSLSSLSDVLAKVSDEDFANLKITQEYTKEDFIQNVLRIVKDMDRAERQKVYDYFGFELHHNKKTQSGFSITGYPVNLNNGKKLAQISDPRTKEIVELLRPEVIRFSEKNPVRCSIPGLKPLLDEILDVLPELRAQIGKIQHDTHSFDVFQHSLKVMQKISQDVNFKTLNESDQKIMMLTSLLHDITKLEKHSDGTHAAQGAFDAMYIAKKFNLTREEEIKLYTLSRHHEWLQYVNTSHSEEELIKRIQSVAYDLQNDNLFDMALIFTHADLRAVKKSDIFHDTIDGDSRILLDGKTRRSYGASADIYAKQIKEAIAELKKSQPFLPVTKIPSASRVVEAITKVKADGSTNIKGVYKDKDGLIILKFNEIEDWEAIGFPEGSKSRGIELKKGESYGGEELGEDVNTGNIHFFAHGLDYENQLIKFDAFSLQDSDALLSISYAERPESKFRFFRAQGALLDFETKYIHGGGNKDSGSGCGKSIDIIKEDYVFGGDRQKERTYISDLIKEATGFSDDEYVKFVESNPNKSFVEIEPIEIREKILKALATINSNTRKGGRSYNEMYGSNPKEVMAPFAYPMDTDEARLKPIEFLKNIERRVGFLRKYALERDKVFIVFGD